MIKKMDDSFLTTFCAQCKTELNMKLKNVAENPILATPSYYIHYFIRLLSHEYLNEKFSKVIDMSTIEKTDEQLNLLIIIPNEPEFMRKALKIYKIAPNAARNIFIFPRYGILCEKLVEKSGLEPTISITEFYFDLLPLESYHFLVPTINCFRRVFLEEENESLFSISRALTKVEMLAGIFPQILSVGSVAPRVQNLMQENRAKIGASAFNVPPTYSKLIIVDRIVDILTPLITEFTYGAVLDALVDSSAGIYELPDTIQSKQREITLNDADEVFKEIRTQALPKAAITVQDKITDISKTKEGLKSGMDMSSFKKQALKADHLAQIKPLLELHIGIMDHLVNIVGQNEHFKEIVSFEADTLIGSEPEPLLAQKYLDYQINYCEAIRLFSLASYVRQGFPKTYASEIRQQMVCHYGADFLEDLDNLDRLGLLTQMQGGFFKKTNQWKTNWTEYKLMPSDRNDPAIVEKFNENDLGSFFDGYIPLMARIVQHVNEIKNDKETPKICSDLKIPFEASRNSKLKALAKSNDAKKVMVFIIGGVTPGEVALFRDMGKILYQGNIEFHIGSTHILNGTRFIQEICPHVEK